MARTMPNNKTTSNLVNPENRQPERCLWKLYRLTQPTTQKIVINAMTDAFLGAFGIFKEKREVRIKLRAQG